MRAAAALAVAAALPWLGGCGTNLLVLRQDVVAKREDGSTVTLRVEFRPREGMLQPNFDQDWYVWGFQTVIGVLFEPIDLVGSTVGAIRCVIVDDARVAGGPLGWIAAMTPFATLMPSPYAMAPRGEVKIDEATWRDLHSDDAWRRRVAARAFFGDHRIVSVEILPPRADR